MIEKMVWVVVDCILFIQEKFVEFFKKVPLSSLNPYEAVALGANLQAEAFVKDIGKLLICDSLISGS